MNGLELATFWMSVVGFVCGLYAIWRLEKDHIADLQIKREHPSRLRFRIVNHSKREIPIEKIRLQLWNENQYEDVLQAPILEGISVPGKLPPESSFRVRWVDNDQLLQLLLSDKFKLIIETQTGSVFSYKDKARPPRSKSKRNSDAPPNY